MSFLLLRSSEAIAQASLTGLEWDGTAGGTGPTYANAATKRGWYLSNPPPMTPMTVLMKLLTRSQVGTTQRFHTGCFYGNHGDFDTFAGYDRAYFGMHGYPAPGVPSGAGEAKLELAADAGDKVTRDDASSPFLTYDQWFSLALVTSHTGATWDLKLYCDLPSTSTANTISYARADSDVVPPTPVLMFGQTGSRQTSPLYDSASWGNMVRWEELRGIERGYQVYSSALSQAQIVALGQLDYDADVLDYCSSNSIASLEYLNMNPTPSDITDKSGNGWHGTWDGANRPSLWTNA